MSPAASTQAWRDRWRAVGRRRAVALIAIGPDRDGPFILYAATEPTRTPDGQQWEPLVAGDGQVQGSTPLASCDVTSATMTFSLHDRDSSALGQALGAGAPVQLSRALAMRQFVGLWVRLWLWETSAPSFADALPRYTGRIQSYRTRTGRVDLSAALDTSWNQLIQPRTVERSEFPNAQEDAVGAGLPIVLGRVGGAPMRSPPHPSEYGDNYRVRELIAGGSRVSQAVLVDVGLSNAGTGRAKVMVAGHKLARFGNFSPNWGASPFLDGGEFLHSLDPLLADVFNADDGAGFYLPAAGSTAYYPLFPGEVEASTNPASNQRAVLDRRNEFSSASFDYGALRRTLYLRMPSSEDLGDVGTTTQLYVLYRSSPSLSGFAVTLKNTIAGVGEVLPLPPTASPFVAEFRNLPMDISDAVMPSRAWGYSEWRLEFGFTGGSPAGWAEVVLAGCAVPYTPRRDVVSSRKVVEQVKTYRSRRRKTLFFSHALEPPHSVVEVRERVESVTRFVGKFYFNAFGAPDDGSGTYTGTPAAPIERVPDMLRYVLRTFGGVDDADIESGAGEWGSFADARAALKTWCALDMVGGLSLAEAVDVSTAVPWIAGAGVAQPLLSEFDGRWRLLPWVMDPPVTYPMPVSRRDLLDPAEGPRVEMMTDATILASVRVPYGWDAQRAAFAHEARVGASSSSGGHRHRDLRDSLLTVTAGKNDKLDFTTGAAHTATLTPGHLDPWARALDVRAAMKAADPGSDFWVTFGPRLGSGYNDRLYWVDGTGAHDVYLGDADFATFEDLCAAVASAMNSASTGYSVTFNRATRKVTVSRSGSFSISPIAGTAWSTLGLNAMLSGTGPFTGEVEVEERRFTVARYAAALSLNWRTGPNGLEGTKQSCWEVLGFDWVEECDAHGLRSLWTGQCPKFDLEAVLAARASEFSRRRKRDVVVEGRGVFDSATALECRNRLVPLLGQRPLVSFASEVLADMRRGDVFEFSVDMDGVGPYPVPGTDGSWAGKRFRVLEPTARFGSSWHAEIVAVDLTS